MNSNSGQDSTGGVSPPAAPKDPVPQPPPAASDGTTGVYGITVAAELAQMSVQALRLYERKGLLTPTRTDGGTRRYSDTDIARLRRIATLINDGINLTGIAHVLNLEADNATLHTHNQALRARNAHLTTTNAALRQRSTNPAAADDDEQNQQRSRHR
jgi:MerR family transcriptional regulator/heat shock protein HspR